MTCSLLPVLFLLLGPVATAGAAETLSAGAAAADITPDPKMMNWTVPLPYGEVHDPLFARALVLSDGETRVAFLVWDLLDAREYAVARVRAALAEATGIPAGNILVQGTHNHSGPKSEMGPEPLTSREARTSKPAQQDPLYRAWANRLVGTCVEVVRKADGARRPATLAIGRAYVGEWLFNRRPIQPDGMVRSTLQPNDPYVMPGGMRFGKLDPTMTVVSLQADGGQPIATLLQLSVHSVSVYGEYKGVSADWPGATVDRVRGALGGEAIFLQGCAGDVVPSRRGFAAVKAMSELIAGRAVAAQTVALRLVPGKLRVSRAVIGLPATEAAGRDLKRGSIASEVQVITCGPLAIVTLPGEPLQDIGNEIQARSPFPHTLVLGYANGRGVGYVGLPGGKAKGGYEMSEVGHGADEAGGFLAETAVRLLREHATAAAGK
ncbi:MAG: neutral/alkaline non-lysosomal ceramidase N-terminal domain-containing protein [Verrucomicrobia bacterium]|nr:neutral/alkaline non-lysosomal ceramidase N-terminal domain-containing protein [Verrucomicrobiota bacterium]